MFWQLYDNALCLGSGGSGSGFLGMGVLVGGCECGVRVWEKDDICVGCGCERLCHRCEGAG
jgi:hypothetical protein